METYKSDNAENNVVERPLYAGDHPDFLRKLIEKQRRGMRLAKIREFFPLAWFCDEFPPQEMYRNNHYLRRSTRQEAQYQWLKQRTGWTFLSNLKSATGAKFAAFAGLVCAVLQAVPQFQSPASMPFRWLLISGLCYLVAVIWFELCCPLLIKQVLTPNSKYLGQHGRRWLQVLVEDEFRRWWDIKKWRNNAEFGSTTTQDATALAAIKQGYGVPVFVGFNAYAQAHIELALSEFSRIGSVKLWRRSACVSNLELFSPTYIYDGAQPTMGRFRIDRPSSLELEEHSKASEEDFVIQWYESGLHISHEAPNRKNLEVSFEAEGLQQIFETDANAIAFTEIIAYWQETVGPFRRLVLLSLYALSAISFGWFVITQMGFVLQNLRFA